jgi:sec-independent protein translocase protein TatA
MSTVAIFGPLGTTEILIILVIIVLLFGARRIPELARGLGEGIRTFKSGLHSDEQKEIEARPESREEPRST